MASLTIDKDLLQGRSYKFKIIATFYDERVESSTLEFKVPNAIKALRKSGDLVELKVGATSSVPSSSPGDQIVFDAYKKFIASGNKYRLTIRLPKGSPGSGNRSQLAVGDNIVLTAPGPSTPNPRLTALNGKSFKIVAKRPNPDTGIIFLDLAITKNEYDSIDPAVVNKDQGLTGHYIVPRSLSIKTKRYAVKIGEQLINKLINKGNVRDIIVFAYRRFENRPTTKDKLTYMMRPNWPGDSLVDKSTPPTWEFVQQYLVRNQQVDQFGQDFVLTDKNKFNFYVTAVRYIAEEVFNEETDQFDIVWKGTWLQSTGDGEPRWALATTP